jgi:pimeloyl-ACP methyl ester carboxylesterase
LQALWLATEGDTAAAEAEASALTAAEAAQSASSAPSVYTGLEQSYAVLCTDTADPRTPAAYEAAARLADARAGGFGLYWAWSEEVCANWPGSAGQDVYTGPWNRWTANPILVIGVTGDPVTPYSGSIAMARDLARGRLLTVDGYGHTEFANPSTCAAIDEINYLTTGALPAAGSVCQQDGTPF